MRWCSRSRPQRSARRRQPNAFAIIASEFHLLSQNASLDLPIGRTDVQHTRSAPSPLVGEGWGGGSGDKAMLVSEDPHAQSPRVERRETAGVDVMPADEPRVWATRDRAKAPPQRQLARQMRGAPTKAERKLWWHLRHRFGIGGTHFRRQVQIARYIVDFACHAKRVIIEVDGGQHATQSAADAERTSVLEANGYRVLRYWNNDVLKNIEGVLEDIHRAIGVDPHPQPLPTRGRGADRICCTFVRQHQRKTV